MSSYNVYSPTLSSARLSSYTPRQYSGNHRSNASSYLYKPPLPTSSFRSTLPSYLGSSYYTNSTGTIRNIGSSYYTNSGIHTSNLGSNYYTSSRSSTSNLGSSYLPSSTYETPSRRNSTIDSTPSRPITDDKSNDCKSSYSCKKTEDDKQRVGLNNLGNTCFMNAVLQCLCHTQPLVDYCIRGSYRKDLNYSSPTRGDLIKVFAEFVQNVIEAKSAVSPHQLRSEVQRCAPRFSGNSQQDAQEFLRYLMQGLHDDIKRASYRSSKREDYGESWRRYQDSDDSLIVDLFAGQLKSTLQCTNCKNDSITHDPFWDLSLPIPEESRSASLRQCFSLFSYPEILDEQNKAFCEMCKKKNRSSKKIEVHKFPRVLVIHLKRFSTSGYARKINIMVDCPLVLRNLSEFSSRNGYRDSSSYVLYGVVDHVGTSNSGHYIAKCKNPYSKEWNEFNDSRVTRTTDVITNNSYMLFYIQE